MVVGFEENNFNFMVVNQNYSSSLKEITGSSAMPLTQNCRNTRWHGYT